VIGAIDGYQEPRSLSIAALTYVDLTVTPSLQPRSVLVLHSYKAEISLFGGVHGGGRSDASNGCDRCDDER